MKQAIKITLASLMALIIVLCSASCGAVDKDSLWENATYTESVTLGEGERVLNVEFAIGEKVITFTINTDKETVGAALSEHSLIEGKDGLYTKVNGVVADYTVDGSYWGFYIDGGFGMTGMDDTPIEEGVVYRLEYTK